MIERGNTPVRLSDEHRQLAREVRRCTRRGVQFSVFGRTVTAWPKRRMRRALSILPFIQVVDPSPESLRTAREKITQFTQLPVNQHRDSAEGHQQVRVAFQLMQRLFLAEQRLKPDVRRTFQQEEAETTMLRSARTMFSEIRAMAPSREERTFFRKERQKLGVLARANQSLLEDAEWDTLHRVALTLSYEGARNFLPGVYAETQQVMRDSGLAEFTGMVSVYPSMDIDHTRNVYKLLNKEVLEFVEEEDYQTNFRVLDQLLSATPIPEAKVLHRKLVLLLTEKLLLAEHSCLERKSASYLMEEQEKHDSAGEGAEATNKTTAMLLVELFRQPLSLNEADREWFLSHQTQMDEWMDGEAIGPARDFIFCSSLLDLVLSS